MVFPKLGGGEVGGESNVKRKPRVAGSRSFRFNEIWKSDPRGAVPTVSGPAQHGPLIKQQPKLKISTIPLCTGIFLNIF